MQIPKVSYEYYFNSYCLGKESVVPKSDFDFFAMRATDELLSMCTGEVLPVHIEKVRTCICEMADALFEKKLNANKKSENIDGYSVVYSDCQTSDGVLFKIAVKHLIDTGLLYKGVETC